MDDETRARYKARKCEANAANPERTSMHDRKKLMKRYGLTPETYDALLASQGGVCAICGGPPRGKSGILGVNYHIDHDHESGAVRGLLCGPCNAGLGSFKDNVARLADAISYLQNPPAAKVRKPE